MSTPNRPHFPGESDLHRQARRLATEPDPQAPAPTSTPPADASAPVADPPPAADASTPPAPAAAPQPRRWQDMPAEQLRRF